MNLANATLIGRLGFDATSKSTANGGQVVRLKLAISTGWGQKKEMLWVPVTVFGKLADFAAGLTKGQTVAVVGRMEANTWTDKEGKSRTDMVVVASELQKIGTMDRHAEPEMDTGDIPF